MTTRTILRYPDPRLREVAKPVQRVTASIRALAEDMAESMYAAPGVGLAAPQIGESLRMFVIDVASEGEPSALTVFVDPEIIAKRGKLCAVEGCLSFPTIYEHITRAAVVTVRATSIEGERFELTATGLLATAIQHEHDHLDGRLMIDHLSPLKRRIVHRKMMRLT